MNALRIVAVVATLAAVVPASAAETITYKYDARGRLVKVVRTGTVNSGVTAQYTHDAADNRKTVKVTGAP